jgi:hypothetical protein
MVVILKELALAIAFAVCAVIAADFLAWLWNSLGTPG